MLFLVPFPQTSAHASVATKLTTVLCSRQRPIWYSSNLISSCYFQILFSHLGLQSTWGTQLWVSHWVIILRWKLPEALSFSLILFFSLSSFSCFFNSSLSFSLSHCLPSPFLFCQNTILWIRLSLNTWYPSLRLLHIGTRVSTLRISESFSLLVRNGSSLRRLKLSNAFILVFAQPLVHVLSFPILPLQTPVTLFWVHICYPQYTSASHLRSGPSQPYQIQALHFI